jgi:acyl-CoA thioester hydrolase
MEPIHEYPVLVFAESMDPNGHANNVEYVRWMQQAAISHSDATGCTEVTKNDGASWVVRSHHVEYLRPVFAGQKLVVKTWVSTMRKTSSLRKYLFLRAGEPVARGETLWVFINADTGRPRSIPDEVSGRFQLVPQEGEPSPATR